MAEYFMGQELIQGELPANSPKPAETPPEGVIMTDISTDGWSRRYIYISMAGSSPEEILISETPPAQKKRISGVAMALEDAPAEMEGVIVPNGIVMPEGALLPEGAVFSGIPSEARPAMASRAGIPAHQAPAFQRPQMAGGPVSMQQQPPLRINAPIQQSPVSVPTVSIQKAAPQAPSVMVQTPQAPVLGGELQVPFVQKPVNDAPEMSGNVRLSNSIEALKPVTAHSVSEAPRMAMQERPMLGQGSRSLPLTTQEGRKDSYPVSNPIVSQNPAGGMSQINAPSGYGQNQVPLRHLGQAAPAAPAASAPPPSTTGGKCPGAVEMPDGRTIEPEDSVTLKDLCELMPFLVETLTNMQSKGVGPGQKVPVVGQQANGQTAVPTQGSPYGRSTGGWVGGGGGGPGPTGPTGPVGPVGATGPGSIVEPPAVKVDGDFTAGPGAFVPVPGTTVPFTMSKDGVAEVKAIVTLGSALTQFCESVQIGVRIDGTDYPLTVRLINTGVVGVDEYLIGQCFTFPITLLAGAHTADLLIRGLLPGEFGAGLGNPGAVSANPSIPLIMSVSHS